MHTRTLQVCENPHKQQGGRIRRRRAGRLDKLGDTLLESLDETDRTRTSCIVMLLLCHIPMAGRPSENIFVRDPHHQSRLGPTHQGLHSTHRLILDDGNTPPCFAGRCRGARGISTGISAMHSTEVFGRVVNAFSPRFLDVLAQGVFKGKRQSLNGSAWYLLPPTCRFAHLVSNLGMPARLSSWHAASKACVKADSQHTPNTPRAKTNFDRAQRQFWVGGSGSTRRSASSTL